MDAVRYMHEHGATRAELASVAVKDRRHASLNPIAQFRKPLTLEEVLAARPIVEPLGLYEVPPRGDGAVCLVVLRGGGGEGDSAGPTRWCAGAAFSTRARTRSTRCRTT